MSWTASDDSGVCVRLNSAGVPYEEFSCLYPTLGKTYLRFETGYDPGPVYDWMKANPWFPIVTCVLYYVLFNAGQAYFANRLAWNWRGVLAFWNLGLSLFSLVTFCRVFPHALHIWLNYSWRENFCMDSERYVGSGSTGLWMQLFILSKFPELLDTLFIVIHKKKLIFLHWYHHISVLLFCWAAYIGRNPTGIWFCSMNAAVHAIMYFYYFLMAVHVKPTWFKPVWITIVQILQMIGGVTITVVACFLLYWERPKECTLNPSNNAAALVMYGSYLFLFLQFFFQRYSIGINGGASRAKKRMLKTNFKTA